MINSRNIPTIIVNDIELQPLQVNANYSLTLKDKVRDLNKEININALHLDKRININPYSIIDFKKSINKYTGLLRDFSSEEVDMLYRNYHHQFFNR